MSTTAPEFFHLSPTSPARTRLKEAEYYFLTGNLNEALAAAQQAWREHADDPDVFRVLAYLHIARGEYQPAAQAAFQAVKLDSGNPASYATQAQVYLTFNMLKLADETLAIARQSFPGDNAILTLAADVSFRRGLRREGEALAREVLARNPRDGYAMALLGAHHLHGRKYHDAARMLEGAVMAYPQRWDYLRDYGIALLHLDEVTTAREALARAYQLNPADPRTAHHLLYAIRFAGGQAWYWKASRYFYSTVWLGVLLFIAGIVFTLVGGIWGLVLAFSGSLEGLLSLSIASMVFTLGLAMLVFTSSGIFMHYRKGRKLDAFLRREIGA